MYVFPATHYVAGPGADGARDRRHRGRARRPARRARAAGQAARGPAAAHEDDLRHRDDAPGRLVLRHRELLPAHRRPGPGSAPNTLLDYFPEDFLLVIDESHVTVPQIGAMYEGDMSRKRQLVDHGFRLPSAMDNRPLKWEEFLERIGQTVYLSATPGRLRAVPRQGRRRADHPPDRPDRPADRRQADQGPDRRPARRDPRPGREGRARPGHDAHQEDVRGPHRLPAGAGRAGPLPPLRGRHAAPGRAAARAAAGRVRRARRHQPAPRGPRPARGVAGEHPRRRQGGLPALVEVPHPDDRPRRPQRLRRGAHVRRHRSRPRCGRPSTRRTAAARSRSPTTPSAASTRSRCASGSPTSPTSSPARTRTPRR